MPQKTIQEVLRQYTDQWMAIAGVVGTAIGQVQSQPCIKILLARPAEQLAGKLPSMVQGYRVVLEETDQFRAL